MRYCKPALAAVPLIAALLMGCADERIAGHLSPAASAVSAPAPVGVQTVNIASEALTLWPFTGTDLAGSASDPINLIFRGRSDARALRAALFALDGNRQAFGLPNLPPFNCTWTDAYGDIQTSYASERGWTASVAQLQCGNYGPVRFHLRLFPQGEWTLANAHFEVLIPGTADHQVLSWQLAKQLVTVDFIRSGLLGAPPILVPGLHPPAYRTIPVVIYNALPPELKLLAGGPPSAVTDVPILSDGFATVLTLAASAPLVADVREEILTLQYNQVIPRPFCSTGPQDFVHVQGPVTLERRVEVSADSVLTSHLRARAQLSVTPVNPLTGERGDSAQAVILDTHDLLFGDTQLSALSRVLRKENRAQGDGTSLQILLQVGPADHYSRTERCN
jgi:hypothetical protein